MKYKLLKKWHRNQLEEVGHVFEEDKDNFIEVITHKDMEGYEYTKYISSYEIALLVHAGFLKEVKESKIELWSIDEIRNGDFMFFCNGVDDETIYSIEFGSTKYHYNKNFNLYILKSGQAHKTRESAELYYKQIMNS